MKAQTESQLMRRSQAIRRLGQQLYRDAVRAGWLVPCAIKPGLKREVASRFFAAKDVVMIEKRLLKGEYPQ